MDRFEKLNQFFKEQKRKYFVGGIIFVVAFIFIMSIVLGSFELDDDIFQLILLFEVVGILVLFALFIFSTFKKLNKNHSEMLKTIEEVELNYEKYKKQLKEMGFVSSKHYSGFGYKWVEFRNIAGVVDNLHLEIDETNKKVAFYFLSLDGDSQLIMLNYSDLISVKLECEEMAGKVVTYAVSIKVNHEIGEIGLPVNDNEGFVLSSEKGIKYQKQAEQLIKEINEIIIKG